MRRRLPVLLALAALAVSLLLPLAPAPRATAQATPAEFRMGLFEDFGLSGVSDTAWSDMIASARAHNLDGAIVTNGAAGSQDARLAVSDAQDFPTILGPMVELEADWWGPGSVTETVAGAHAVVDPLLDQLMGHPSLEDYIILDDATGNDLARLNPMVEAIQAYDPTRAALPVLVNSQQSVYPGMGSLPKAAMTYSYPYGTHQDACDTTYPGNGAIAANTLDQVLRQQQRFLAGKPHYAILQAHGEGAMDLQAPDNNLRRPTAAEMRLQHWLALGERVDAIYWFMYGSIPGEGITGLSDPSRADLYGAVSEVSGRTRLFESMYVTTERAAREQFTVSTTASLDIENTPYVSTLVAGNTYYAVVVNRSCASQDITVASAGGLSGGSLINMETGQVAAALGGTLTLAPGDGRFLRLDGATGSPLQPAPVNLIANGGFEAGTTFPDDWGSAPTGGSRDTTVARSGGASLKMTEATGSTAQQFFTLDPNTRYALDYWLKADGVTAAGVEVRYATTSPTLVMRPAPNPSLPHGGTTEWVRVRDWFYTPPEATGGVLQLIWTVNSGATAWIDDLRLCVGDTCDAGTVPALATATPTVTPSPTATATPAPQVGLPALPADYTKTIEEHWATHPFNPLAAGYVPVGSILSPSPQVNITSYAGNDLQLAIDDLPAGGGTVYLPNGTYDVGATVTGRSNIHLVGESEAGVVLQLTSEWGALTFRACALMADYTEFNAQLDVGTQANQDCVTTGRIGNLYFKNLTFDGAGLGPQAVVLAGVDGAVFDNVTWRGFGTTLTHPHPGQLSATMVSDNIWLRGNTHEGPTWFIHYLDGCHFCGDTESVIHYNYDAPGANGSGGALFMSQDDLSADYNDNGVLDPNEQRQSKYIVFAHNEWPDTGPNTSATIGVNLAATRVLIKANTAARPIERFVYWQGKCDNHNTPTDYGTSVHYVYEDMVIDGNVTDESTWYAHFDKGGADGTPGNGYECGLTGTNYYTMGDYKVVNNTVAGGLWAFVYESQGSLDSPRVEANNCVSGAFIDGPSQGLPCGTAATPTPTPSPTPVPTCHLAVWHEGAWKVREPADCQVTQ